MPVIASSDPHSFKQRSAMVLASFRSHLLDVLDTVPGHVRKSRDVQKHFGLDAKLSWQLYRIATGGNPLELASHIPSSVPFHKLLTVAARKGVPPHLVSALSDAFNDFQSYVETYAGDRKIFDSMLSDLTDVETGAQSDLQHRKVTFECHRHYWGLQVRTHILATIIVPQPKQNGIYDLLRVSSVLGIERLRADVKAVLTHPAWVNSENPDSTQSRRPDCELLECDGDATVQIPVLPAYSSLPLPEMTTADFLSGTPQILVTGNEVGRQAASDISLGCIQRGVGLAMTDDHPLLNSLSLVHAFTFPTQTFVLDTLIHRSMASEFEAALSLYGHFNGAPPHLGSRASHIKLPCREKLVAMGAGTSALRTPDAPRYVEMLQFACDKMGLNLDEFDVYRVTVPFPMLNTSLVNRVSWTCC